MEAFSWQWRNLKGSLTYPLSGWMIGIKMSWMGKYEPEAEVVSVDIQTTKNKTTWLDHTWVGHLKNRGMFEKAVDEVQEVVGMDVKVSYWGDEIT